MPQTKVRCGRLVKPKLKSPAQKKPQDLEVSTSELAVIVGKTPQWISQLTREGVLRKVEGARGKYVLSDAVRAYCDHVAGGKEKDNRPRFIDEKTEHERVKKEIALLELDEKRNNLHTTSEVLDTWGELLVAFRERLSGLPPKLAKQLIYMSDEKEIRRVLEERITEALIQLSKFDPLADDA